MINFKKETIEAIIESGHELKDVMFIGSYDGAYRMNIDKFLEKSDFIYDDSYGSSKIATNLIVYFNDKSYLSRGEYDGSEWWEYNKLLEYKETDSYEDFDVLGGLNYMWETVKEMNDVNYNEDGYLIGEK